MSANLNAYAAAHESAVFLDRSDRARLEITGTDRAKFLHNLTTNDVKRLPVRQGVEAFVTSPQGKTMGFVILHALEDRILLRADPGGVALVLPHLQKYGVFDEVSIENVSGPTFEYHLAGPSAESAVLEICGLLPEPGDLRTTVLDEGNSRLIRESPFGVPGYTLIGPVSQASALRGRMGGLIELDLATAEALRIEAGTPVFGRDLNGDNLPQEVSRDDRAINFVKGCYLGQETVARLDALGHVNKILRGLRIVGGEPDTPAVGAPIEADGKLLGKITSATYSEGLKCPVALGYVRISHATPGTEVFVSVQDRQVKAVVSAWPIE